MAQLVGDDIQRVGEIIKGDVVAVAENHLILGSIPISIVVPALFAIWLEVNAANEGNPVVIKGVAVKDFGEKVVCDFESIIAIVDLAVLNARLSLRSRKCSGAICGFFAVVDLSLHRGCKLGACRRQSLLRCSLCLGGALLRVSDCFKDILGDETRPSRQRTNMSFSTQLMALIGIRLYMFQCTLTGDTRLFRDGIRAGYSLEYVWWHKAADSMLLDFLHDRAQVRIGKNRELELGSFDVKCKSERIQSPPEEKEQLYGLNSARLR